MTRPGWMINGPRTLAEQMKGLGPALAEAPGKTVLDLGCAEGLIAIEFAKAGARSVRGIEYNLQLAAHAQQLVQPYPQISVEHDDLRNEIARPRRPRYDLVLALAIIHKLPDPEAGLCYCAAVTSELLVIRLPIRSTGRIESKFAPFASIDSRSLLPALGFRLDRKEDGPRGEQVRYWRRIGNW